MDRAQFPCPSCQKAVTVDRKYLGLRVACPHCLANVVAPLDAAACVPPEKAGPPRTPDGLAFKPCPYCTEYVSPRVLKCDHCGHRLDVPLPESDWKLRKAGPRTCPHAIASLVLAPWPLLSIGGIVCGHVAVRRIRRSPVLYKGLALARWGKWLSYLFTIGYVVYLILKNIL